MRSCGLSGAGHRTPQYVNQTGTIGVPLGKFLLGSADGAGLVATCHAVLREGGFIKKPLKEVRR